MPRTATSGRQPASDPTTRWARDVVAGRIISGELAVGAAERHLKDLKDGKKRGLYYDAEAAARAIGFFPAVLSITAGAAEGKPFTLLPWHVFAVGSIFGWKKDSGRLRFRRAWLETGKGQAKALALDTPIPTPDGWKLMGDLCEGDFVFGADGKPTEVVAAHPVVTGQDCYRLTFDDGQQIVANAGHLWVTEQRRASTRADAGRALRGVRLADRGKWRIGVRTTDQIAETLRYKNGRYLSANHSIALCGALDLPEATLPIPPYALGFWLGDGDSDGARVTIGNADAEESSALLASHGAQLGAAKAGKRYSVSIPGGIRKGLGAQLKKLGLFGNKHIPEPYLRASMSQRLELLRGLMDTDGTVSNHQCSFTNTNERLARGVHELALSLGYKATLVETQAKLNGRLIGPCFRVNFYADGRTPVFGLTRKQQKVTPTHSRRRLSGDRKIVACEKIASVPVRCITVANPEGMFLCGRNMVPTHNSPLMAGIGILMMGWHGVKRAEVYAIGQDRATANVLFKDAVAMCRAPIPGQEDVYEELRETLENRGDVIIRGEGDNAWKIEHPDTGSKFQSLANGDAISGPRPVAVLADEIHEFKSNASIETWQRAIAKMPGDALMLLGTNTPASTQLIGTQYSEFFQKIARGEMTDDEAFAFIARVDKDDRENIFDNEKAWAKALPALNVTFPIENIRGEVNTARLLISTAMSVKRLYFGIPTGAVEFWIDETAWEAVQGGVNPDELRGCPCWMALDLSQKNDLTALTVVWIKDGTLYAKTWYWTTEAGLEDRAKKDAAPYTEWVLNPDVDLEAVNGAVIDKTFVAAQVQRICEEHDVQFLAFDPAGIADFERACEEIGFATWKFEGPDKPAGIGLKLVSHAQGTRVVFEDRQLCMPRSIERFEDKILKQEIVIDASPVTYMCAGNAMVTEDGQKNRAFDKKRSRGRIDGLVTLAMAVGAATQPSPDAKEPEYDLFFIGG